MTIAAFHDSWRHYYSDGQVPQVGDIEEENAFVAYASTYVLEEEMDYTTLCNGLRSAVAEQHLTHEVKLLGPESLSSSTEWKRID